MPFRIARGTDAKTPKLDLPCDGRMTGMSRFPDHDAKLSTSGRRLAYARHLTDGKHPLVTRVLMNRVWLNHFGKGLVDTPGDFGNLGMRPTHPELLEWLAAVGVQIERA